MSHREQDLPSMTMYSDEISMGSGNGSNGVPALSAVVPSAIEEPKASLVLQIALQRPIRICSVTNGSFCMHRSTIGISRVLQV